ncbi:hypothetical protein FAUST_4230 [Fusarium austroamericanum]|uniref:Uncharacterized protein n=1 Tax=Fusarium austroamericanum TaxID=282268 RepID=A0AAN6C3D1_FUSAU|nr:hypothetical protein FAUST_4230 [Fusarium austroamericanum]
MRRRLVLYGGSVEFPGYVRPALKHLANVPEVAQSVSSRAAVIETIVDRSQKSERTLRLQRRRLARELDEKNNCHNVPQLGLAPPTRDEPKPLQGLDSIDIGVALVESAQTSRIIARKDIDETALEDMEPIAVDSFAVMMGLSRTELDLDQLCEEHGITPWPELKLYTGDRAAAV